jgi:hypothetical protein
LEQQRASPTPSITLQPCVELESNAMVAFSFESELKKIVVLAEQGTVLYGSHMCYLEVQVLAQEKAFLSERPIDFYHFVCLANCIANQSCLKHGQQFFEHQQPEQ